MRYYGYDCYLACMQSPWDGTRFGLLLSEIMATAGLNQVGLAKATDVNPSLISRWLRGETQPGPENIRKLIAGIRREYPDLAGRAAGLVDAAGLNLAYLASPADDRPQIVRDNWHDEDVRKVWDLSVTADQRLSIIEDILGRRPPAAARGKTA